MTDPPHTGLGDYLLDELTPQERSRFERHLAGCEECRESAATLRPVVDVLGDAGSGWDLDSDRWEPPADLERRTLAAVEREAALTPARSASTPRRERARRPWPRILIAGAAAAALGAVFLAGTLVAGDEGQRSSTQAGSGDRVTPGRDMPAHPPGLDGDKLPILLAARGGGRPRAHALMRRSRFGVVVTFHSDHLRPPGRGRHYELWLVGPGDSRDHPNRISAGTFVPDAKGTSFPDLTTAADPREYGVVAITLEPDDGGTGPTLPDIVRSDWSKRCTGARRVGAALPAGCR